MEGKEASAFAEELTGSGGAVGRHFGRQTAPIASRPCVVCGKTFTPHISTVRRGGGTYCSRYCVGFAPKRPAHFQTPESTKAERIRANGLVNMRMRRGGFAKPTSCQKCGAEKRLDKHHPDYAEPDAVLFLCRACHMQSHHNPSILNGLTPVVIGIVSPSPTDRSVTR